MLRVRLIYPGGLDDTLEMKAAPRVGEGVWTQGGAGGNNRWKVSEVDWFPQGETDVVLYVASAGN